MLYIVATPIGNLGDITQRALEVLQNADLIAAEDTRHTLGMLTHFGIKKPLISYYEENKIQRGPEILKKLSEGLDIALVSDAGMPGISDPGSDLIKEAIANDIPVTVVPGAAACVTAVVLSGFSTRRFVFEGFLPFDKKERKAALKDIEKEKRTCVIYEAPHRLLKTLETLTEVTAGRRIAVCRELTKKFEEIKRGSAEEMLEYFTQNGVRGEFVLVIEGREEAGLEENAHIEANDEDIFKYVNKMIEDGNDKKTSMKLASEHFGVSKNDIYASFEKMKNS
ncbi:MAG: 16S rRNA (cytidine(1402)-2'-O)-methyltransferase [Clostridia bacterium]|nr:16S rRNA (cytidine(1402)-2'-O)-methyltransferase [Clostridia bacterium]